MSLKGIRLRRKKDIYKGGEIGYDEAEKQVQAEPLIIQKREESLKERVRGVSTSTLSRAAPNQRFKLTPRARF